MIREWIDLVESASVEMDQRLKRAKAMGFDIDEIVYHGTMAGEFDSFKTNYRKHEQLGFGIHVTPVHDFAKRYADEDLYGRKGKNPHVFVGYLRKGKVLIANALVREGTPEFELAKKLAGSKLFTQKDENGIPTAWMQNAIDSTSGQRAEKLIKAAGYDTIQYNAKAITLGPGSRSYSTDSEAVSYVVLDPKNLRRIDAEFDPAKSDSVDLRA